MSTPSAIRTVEARLTQAGAPFEISEISENGVHYRTWKNGPQTLLDIFAGTAPFEDRVFVVLGDQRLTYGGFRNGALRIAAWLRSAGIGSGDVVAIAMGNRPEWLAAYFGTALAGATSALINPAGTQAELSHALALSRARVLICTTDVLQGVAASAGRHNLERALAIGAQAPVPAAIPVETLRDAIGAIEVWCDLAIDNAVLPPVEPDHIASILFTAGTTGLPKGVALTQRACAYSVFHAAFRNARHAALTGKPLPQPEGQQVLLMALPFYHTSGVCNAVLPLMARGGRIVLMNFWSPRTAIKLIEQEGAHIFGSVPTIVEQLVAECRVSGAPPTLQQAVCGGGPPSSQLAEKIVNLGLAPGQNWGMTETAGALLGIIGAEFAARPTSCGRPAPIHETRIATASGEIARLGEVGELQVRGPQVMTGYIHDPDATAAALTDGWLRTGDLAYLDEDGYCFVVDRAKDMLICAGENVYCIEVENAIATHPKVEEVAVFGAPHALMGEQPVAVVRAREGEVLTDKDIRVHAAGLLPLFKTPSRVLVVTEPLPRNRLGKVQKSELRRQVHD